MVECGKGRAETGNKVGKGNHQPGVDAGVFGGQFIAAGGKNVAAKYRAVENDVRNDGKGNQVEKGPWNIVKNFNK